MTKVQFNEHCYNLKIDLIPLGDTLYLFPDGSKGNLYVENGKVWAQMQDGAKVQLGA